jgi:hypothetical protein
MVRGTEGDGLEAGSIRQSQVSVGAKLRRVSEARFIPPPPGDQLRAMFERWLDGLSADGPVEQIQRIARIAMAHSSSRRSTRSPTVTVALVVSSPSCR